MKGAPIRFVAAVVGGWTCVRIAVLMPGGEPLALAGDVFAPRAEARARPPAHADIALAQAPATALLDRIYPRAAVPSAMAARGVARARPSPFQAAAPPAPNPRETETPPLLIPANVGPVTLAAASMAPARRWSASAWLLARGGAGGTLSGGQLGASQAGARLLYRIDAQRRLSLAGRIAAPLAGRGTEAAMGLDWQPTAAPVHLVAEHRIGLDGARGGPTAMVIAGLNPTPIAAGFRLEAYGQAGAILRSGDVQPFGDGAIRLSRSLAKLGRATIDAGVGAWAAGQPGATRADVGPTIGLVLPVAGRGVRLSLDWRQRVAGEARPGSGPALSIGSDF